MAAINRIRSFPLKISDVTKNCIKKRFYIEHVGDIIFNLFNDLLIFFFFFSMFNIWSIMAINVGCEFRGRGSIPSVCQITDAALGKLANLNHSLNGGLLLD